MNSPSRSKLLVAAALLLALAVGAVSILLTAYHNYEASPSPYSVPLPEVAPTAPISQRVVVVVSDGLRSDLAVEMKNIGSLSRRPDASYHTAVTAVPSLSLPGWTAIMTGAGPLVSGVRTNAFEGSPAPVESLFETARRAGKRTAIAGAATEWDQLFRGQSDEVYVAPFPSGRGSDGEKDSDPLVARALAGPAELMLLYFPAVDDASHYYGPFSDDGVNAMLGFDRRVGEIASRLDFTRDTLIVTSDHGHIDAGGHGGYEDLARGATLLMVGRGISKSGPQAVSQTDIAPTIAVLLGVGRPRDAEGMPLFGSISADSAAEAEAAQIHEAALRRRIAANYEVISREQAPDASVEVLREEIRAASWRRAISESMGRIPIGVLLVALFAMIIRLTGGLKARSVGAALVCMGLAALAVWSSGFTWSMSYFNVSGDESGLLLAALGATVLGMAMAGLIVGNRTTSGAWQQAMSVSAVIVFICGLSASLLMIYYGPNTGWRMPDLRFSWAMFIVPTLVGVASVVGIPLAAATAALAHKVSAKSSEVQPPDKVPGPDSEPDPDVDEGPDSDS